MSDHVNLTLNDSISKRKTEEPRERRRGSDRPFRRGGFRGRDERRNGRGGFRRSFGPRRFERDSFDRDRRRGFRDRGPREDREGRPERREKFGDDQKFRNPISKIGIRNRFIRRTGPARRLGESRPSTFERERERPISERRRLRVSNLDFNITHKDLMELFSKFGSLTKNKIEYDDLGRSKGAALIEYEKHESAVKAMKEYDAAVLDGRTIAVEFDDDVKKRDGESSIYKKVINKDYNYERGGRRSFRFEDRGFNSDFKRGWRRGGFRRSRFDDRRD